MSTASSLTTLLTTESLLFAALNAALGLSGNAVLGPTAASARRLMTAVAGLLTLVAASALVAWIDLFFVDAHPRPVIKWAPAGGIALGITMQPVLAWYIATIARRAPGPDV